MQQQAAAAPALCQLPPAWFVSTSVLSMYRIPAVFVHMFAIGSEQFCLGMVAGKMMCPMHEGLLMEPNVQTESCTQPASQCLVHTTADGGYQGWVSYTFQQQRHPINSCSCREVETF